jgi:hypothetical protein|tara:strand:- start:2927 stop:3553 length:627 start_codon:yes stop_codon:yes gene_type:complete
MSNQKLVSLSLAVSPIFAFVGWIILGAILGFDISPDKPQSYIGALGENSGAVKTIFPIITLLFLVVVAGLGYIRKSMEGGPGHLMARFGFLLMVIAAPGFVAEGGLQMGVAEAASLGSLQTAQTLFAAGNAIGAMATALMFIGFLVIGIGILKQKNFHIIIAVVMVIAGIFTTAICVIDYSNQLIIIGYVGFCLASSALGISLLRSSE